MPDLQCPQLLLQPPRLLLQVQVLHRERAHVLGGGGGGDKKAHSCQQQPPHYAAVAPEMLFWGVMGMHPHPNLISGCRVPSPPQWVNHLCLLGNAPGSLLGGRRIRPPPVGWLLLHGSGVWGRRLDQDRVKQLGCCIQIIQSHPG